MPLALTSDIEWSSEEDIAALFGVADALDVPLFPFVTHDSAFLKARGGAQGIHPNFLPGSTHGQTETEVIAHCFGLVPDAKAFRSHCFYSNTRLLWAMAERGIVADANLLSYMQYRKAFVNVGGFFTYPTYWSDDVAIRNHELTINRLRMSSRGTLVCNVHPKNARLPLVENLFAFARLHAVPFESLYECK